MESKGESKAHVIIQICVLCSFTRTTLKRKTCPRILELNWDSSYWQWGGRFQRTPIPGGNNLIQVIPPSPYQLIDECVSECSPSPILSMFSRALINMEWSLMARADNLFCLHVNHFDWRDDSLVIYFLWIKKNIEGVDQSKHWHLHSNPNNPENFPVNTL